MLNFASQNLRVLSRVRFVLLFTSFSLMIVSAVVLWRLSALRSEIVSMRQLLATAESAFEQVKPELEERDQLVRNLSSMSALMDARRFSWTRLYSSLESVMPAGVALVKAEYSGKDRLLSLEGTAQSPEALRDLVIGFERSASFTNPYLKHQSLEKGSITFTVVAVYDESKHISVANRQR